MNGTLQALGWTLIHFCWEATAVAVLYAIAEIWLRNARSQSRYLFALAALSSTFLAFVATLGYETLYRPVSFISPFDIVPSHSEVAVPVKAVISRFELVANAPSTFHWTVLLPWLDGIWLLGVIGLSIRSFSDWLWLQRLRRATIEDASEAIQASFEKVCIKLGITRRPELRMSEIVSGPLTIGVLRTLVILPMSSLLALSPEQLEAIFAHELAHVRRADYFWNLVQTLVETLFFFHPAVWWLGNRLREQRELCCDDVAIGTCSDPLVYATALFRLEDQRAAGLTLTMALDGHESGITFRFRILRILGESAPQSNSARLLPLCAFVTCASLFLFSSPVLKAVSFAAQSAELKTSPAPTRPSQQQILSAASHSPARLTAIPDYSSLMPTHGSLGSESSTLPVLHPRGTDSVRRTPVAEPGTARREPELHQQLREAGYSVDLNENRDQIEKLHSLGVTVKYAKSMTQTGLGVPALNDLIQLKSFGVSPDYIAGLKGSLLAPSSFSDVVTVRYYNLTERYAASLESVGLGRPSLQDIVHGKRADFTSEYVANLRASDIAPASLHDAITMKTLGISPEYCAEMASVGFVGVTPAELIKMRSQGLTPSYGRWLKATFPDARGRSLRRAALVHVDAEFIAKSKRSGLDIFTLDRLTELKMSGVLL